MHAAIQGPRPDVHLVALCRDCKRRHEILATPETWLKLIDDWQQKHLGHRIEFRSPKRRLPRGLDDKHFDNDRMPWWMSYGENADMKLAYASSADYTITLADLGSSSTLVAGRESTKIDNKTTVKYLDYLIALRTKTHATLAGTANTQIELWVYGSFNDTPLYPDVVTGTDANVTFTSASIKQASMALANVLIVPVTTANVFYYSRPTSLAALFGGPVPINHGLVVVHNVGQLLHTTGSNHVASYTGAYCTVA